MSVAALVAIINNNMAINSFAPLLYNLCDRDEFESNCIHMPSVFLSIKLSHSCCLFIRIPGVQLV